MTISKQVEISDMLYYMVWTYQLGRKHLYIGEGTANQFVITAPKSLLEGKYPSEVRMVGGTSFLFIKPDRVDHGFCGVRGDIVYVDSSYTADFYAKFVAPCLCVNFEKQDNYVYFRDRLIYLKG